MEKSRLDIQCIILIYVPQKKVKYFKMMLLQCNYTNKYRLHILTIGLFKVSYL